MNSAISAIVPTIGRRDSLERLLEALAAQTRKPDEVIVANAGEDAAIRAVAESPRWRASGLAVRYLHVKPPNAVRQRRAAIESSTGGLLLLLDDDVVPETACVESLERCLLASGAVGVMADFSNQAWPPPTALWRLYLRAAYGINDASWQGKVIGPLLRYGYAPVPPGPVPMQWLGSGNSLIRREAYARAGGFSEFFLHRVTVNEDVDLGLKLARRGPLLLCPMARLAHMHAPEGRASPRLVAEDDLYNRYVIMRRTLGQAAPVAFAHILVYFAIETASGFAASIRHLQFMGFIGRLVGRLSAMARITLPLRT